MQRTDDLHTGLNLPRGFQSAKAFVACRNDFGEVFMQADGANLLEEGIQRGGRNSGSQALDEGRVFLQGCVEGLADGKEV
jgi:hypothetical protein